MGWNGSGTFSITTSGNPVVTGTTISSTWANSTLSEIATGLTTCLTKDGQNTPTGNLPMGGYKHTNVANGSSRTDYAALGQVQDSSATYLTSVSGVDTITASVTGLTAYAAGQIFRFISAGANTGAVTLNINALGAKAITKQGTTALVANDIASGVTVEVIYDGTRFQIVNITATVTLVALTADALSVTGNATVGTTTTNGARTLTVTNTNAGASASANVVTTADSGSLTVSLGSTAAGGTASITSSSAGILNIYTTGASALQLGTNNTPGRLTISSAGAVNAAVSLSENSTRVVSRNSAGAPAAQSYAANAVYTFAHGLSGIPDLTSVWLQCTTADLGYSVGDRVYIQGASTGTALSARLPSVNVAADATNVYVIFNNTPYICNKGTAVNANITASRWDVHVRAWY